MPGWRRGGWMGRRGLLVGVPWTKTAPTDAGGSAVIRAHLREDLHPPRGAGVSGRYGPGESQAVDARPRARAAGRTVCARPMPHPLPHRSGVAARRFRGCRSHGGHAAGGGCHTHHRAGVPPCAHDGTERCIVRPQDSAAQTDGYSGKTKDHAVKNVLLVNAPLTSLCLSETSSGRVHDKRIAEATPSPLPAGSRLLQALGFLAFTLPHVAILMPVKQPRGQELTLEQALANQALHQRRLWIEPVNRSVQRRRIVQDRIRLWKKGIRDLVIDLCCAPHNVRVRPRALATDGCIRIHSHAREGLRLASAQARLSHTWTTAPAQRQREGRSRCTRWRRQASPWACQRLPRAHPTARP